MGKSEQHGEGNFNISGDNNQVMFQAPKTKKAVGWKSVSALIVAIAALATTYDIYRKHTAEAEKPALVVETPASAVEIPLPVVAAPDVLLKGGTPAGNQGLKSSQKKKSSIDPPAALAQAPAQPEAGALMEKEGTPAAGNTQKNNNRDGNNKNAHCGDGHQENNNSGGNNINIKTGDCDNIEEVIKSLGGIN
jgi:hypothetical protein